MVIPWLLACSIPQPAERAPVAALARDVPLLLTVSDLAPGADAGLRVVGPPETFVGLVTGTPGGAECPAGFPVGACFDLTGVTLVDTVKTNVDGAALVEMPVPAGTAVGTVIGFQAMVVEGGAATTISDAVSRTVIDAADLAPPPGHNVLLLLADDVGVDRIGVYGAPAPAITPVLDGLAADGLVFDNAWSLPLCGPTRAALQTGRYPRRTGYGTNQSVQAPDTELDPELTTIAELVDFTPWHEYQTSYVGKWHLASPFSPSGILAPKVQGWDWWTGFVSGTHHWFGPNPGGDAPGYFHFQLVTNKGRFKATDGYATTTTVNEAIDRIGTMREPWMLQVSFNAAHEPYHAPPDVFVTDDTLTDQSPVPDLHRSMVEAMDTELGRLLGALPQDVRDRTMIFFLGDNGTPRPAADATEDRDRLKSSLFDGGIHVPFVVAGPLVAQPGTHTSSFAHVVDLFPTIAEIAGADLTVLRSALDREQPLVIDGVSLVPVLADPTAVVRTTLYSEKFSPGGGGPFFADSRAIREGQYKLMVDAMCGDEQFYEYVPGAPDEGEDLLVSGLTPEQETARAALRVAMDDLVAGMTYDADSWPEQVVVPPPRCGADTGDTGVAGP